MNRTKETYCVICCNEVDFTFNKDDEWWECDSCGAALSDGILERDEEIKELKAKLEEATGSEAKKVLNLEEWLAHKTSVNPEMFWENCQKGNQQWEDPFTEVEPSEMHEDTFDGWILGAFSWEHSLQKDVDWYEVSEAWQKAALEANEDNVEIVFGFNKRKEGSCK